MGSSRHEDNCWDYLAMTVAYQQW